MIRTLAAVGGRTSGERSLGRMLLAKTIGNAGLNAATLALNFVIAFVLSRLLGARGYGAYAFAVALALLLVVPAVLGLPPLVVREVAANLVSGSLGLVRGIIRLSNQAALCASVVVCGVAAVVFAATGWPADPFRAPAFIGLALVPLISIVSLRQSAMQGFGQVVLGRVPEGVISPLLTIAMIVALRLALGGNFSAAWAAGAAVIAFAASLVVGIVLQRRATPAGVRAAKPVYATRRWVLATAPLILMAAISTMNDQIGAVLVGALGNAQEVGVFSVASKVAALIPFFLLAAVPTLMPTIAELHARDERERLQRLMTSAARFVFYGSLPLVAGVVLLAHPLVDLFGASFSGGVTPLRILALGQIVNIATGFPGTILIMVGESGRVTRGVTVGAFANLALSVALIPHFGASGAAVAGAVGIALANIVLGWELWRSNHIWSPALAIPSTATR
jgi:O-antigen/teichoic acid export membrane protein